MRFGIIGGTGMGNLLSQEGMKSRKHVNIKTGLDHVSCTIFSYQGHELVFIDRHMNSGCFIPPHLLRHQNYMNFLASINVEFILASSAVGASHIKGGFKQGDIVVPTDVVDYVQEAYTFCTDNFTHPTAFHRPVDHIFCPQLIAALRGGNTFDFARFVLANSVKGPRFESLAEMNIRVRDGVHLVGMPTVFPEAVLAGELAIPYAVLCGVSNMAPANHDGQAVKEVMAQISKEMTKRILKAVDILIADEGHHLDCPCRQDREFSVFDEIFS